MATEFVIAKTINVGTTGSCSIIVASVSGSSSGAALDDRVWLSAYTGDASLNTYLTLAQALELSEALVLAANEIANRDRSVTNEVAA